MEWIGAIPWGALSPVGTLTIVVLMVLTGKLVPASVVEQQRAADAATIADYRDARRIDAEAQAELRSQLGELISSGKAFDAAWQAIRLRAGVDT